MEERLKYVLSLINEWIRFAEAKSGALLAADAALLFGVLAAVDVAAISSFWLRAYVYAALVLLGLAGLVSLASFVPQLRPPKGPTAHSKEMARNPFFFSDIVTFERDCYLRVRKGRDHRDQQPTLVGLGQVLGDTAAAGAILDRILHHAEVIRLQGKSYRMHNRQELHTKQKTRALSEQG